MLIEEFLIKVGVDASKAKDIAQVVDQLQNSANELNKTAEEITKSGDNTVKATAKTAENAGNSAEKSKSKFSALKVAAFGAVAALTLYSRRLVSGFNNAINSAQLLAHTKGALYKVTGSEIAQTMQYKRALDRTSLSLASIKTRIALNLLPSVNSLIASFNKWLVVNKDVITKGITEIVKWIGKVIQVGVNFIKFIDKTVSKTIGWKNAIIILGVAWAAFNRSLLFSPMGIFIAAMAGILLLIDDFMTYLNGGKSAFPEVWGGLVKWVKVAIDWVTHFRDKINDVVDWFNNLGFVGQSVIVFIISYLTAFASKFIMMKTAAGTINLIGKAFGSLKLIINSLIGVFGKLVAVVIANPIMAIIAAIAVAAFLIYKNWDFLKDFFSNFGENIKNVFNKVWDTIKGFFNDALIGVLKFFGLSDEKAQWLVKQINLIFGAIFDILTYPFKRAWKFISGIFDIWTDDTKSFSDKIKATFALVTNFIKEPFKMAFDWVNEQFDKLVGWVSKGLKSIGRAFGMTFEDDNLESKVDTKISKEAAGNFNNFIAAAGDGSQLGSGAMPYMPRNAVTGQVSNDNKHVNSNNSVVVNTTMNVTTPEQGLNNLNTVLDQHIDKITTNTNTAFGGK